MTVEQDHIIDENLFNKIADGDPQAEQKLLKYCKTIIKVELMVRTRVAAPYKIQNDLIKEILSEIIITLRQKLMDFNKHSFNTYSCKIAQSKIQNFCLPLA